MVLEEQKSVQINLAYEHISQMPLAVNYWLHFLFIITKREKKVEKLPRSVILWPLPCRSLSRRWHIILQ